MMQPPVWRLKLAAAKLARAAVIAYPTEGVWGMGCRPDHEASVKRILLLKNRSWRQGLILVGSDISQILKYAGSLTDGEMKVLEKNWPGPVTFLLPRSDYAPDLIAGDGDKVAVRVSDHAVVSALCRYINGPLISTSANPLGKPPAASQLRLRKYFPQGIDYIFPGELGDSRGATEIRDLRSGEILRAAGT